MDIVDYCQSLEAELTAWRQKLEGLRRLVETLEHRQREAMLSSVLELSEFVDRMAARIDAFRSECPAGVYQDPARATDPKANTAP